MSVPALLVGAAAVGAVWYGSRKASPPSPVGAAQPGSGATNATQGDSYATSAQPSISEPATGVTTLTDASTGTDVGVQTTQIVNPIDPGKTVTLTGGGLGIVIDPSSSGSPSGPASGGMSTGSLPDSGVIAAGQSTPSVLQFAATDLANAALGSADGTTKQVSGAAFASLGSRVGAIW